MTYQWFYQTPDGFDNIILNSDGEYLTKLVFINSYHSNNPEEYPIFVETCKWLDLYFSGTEPSFTPKYKIIHSTPFRDEVLEIMKKIPFGKTITYHDIAKEIEKRKHIKKMSCQAVGGAVGWNPICIIIPCHRVVGVDGNLTGYGGGISNKIALLKLENHDMTKFKISRKKAPKK